MTISLLLLAVLVLLNGLLAMSELAVMTSRRGRLQQQAARGSRGASAALRLADDPTRFLSTVQVGITLIGILAGAIGEKALSGRLTTLLAEVPVLAPHAELAALAVVVLLITYLSLVVGELVPKRIALAHPEAVAASIARPLHLLSTVAAWPVKLLSISTDAILRAFRITASARDEVSEEDVKALLARAARMGVFTPQELGLFHRTMRVGDLAVRDLMVARKDIVWIGDRASIEALRVLVGTNPHSHFPVCEGSLDRVKGVVHVKDLIAHGLIAGRSFEVSSVMQSPLFVPETTPVLRLLDLFAEARTHTAFVVDEYGATRGMLTLNDVARAILGEVRRRGEAAAPSIRPCGDGAWLLDGRLRLHELAVALHLPEGIEKSAPQVSTVAGLVTTILGRIPAEGEQVRWEGLELEVVDMDDARVDKLLVRRQAASAAGSGAEEEGPASDRERPAE
jgi:putative hemolysin